MIKKMKRRGPSLDMTALVDVAFLLLTFFMLTAQFAEPDPIPIVLPSSNTQIKLPATNILMVIIGADDEIYIGEDREEAPRRLRSVADLQQAIVQYRTTNPNLRTVIKADRNADYGPIEDVMKAMRDADVTRFSLITDLEGAGQGQAPE